MYSKFQFAVKFIEYYLTSSNGKGHGMHSPFIYNFITEVLNNKKHYPEYEKVEDLRQHLLKDNTVLNIEDFGAGSSVNKNNKRTVADIVKNSAKSKKMGQLLFRIVKEYQPKTILELGTSLGITTSYLSLANPDSKLITMEGAKEVADIARRIFNSQELQNIRISEGNFDSTLSSVIEVLSKVEGSSVDFAFIDGNHRREPTERYFQQLIPKMNSESILVFDDIHWSREMEQAWETIKKHPSVRCTIDLFFIGIVFFRQGFREQQHFKIRF